MSTNLLDQALSTIPAGPWAVGVSGGADSVALLTLLNCRADLQLHIAHLDHETRQGESAKDAQFVAELCARMNVPYTTARRSEIDPTLVNPPANRSARYRALRL